MIKILLISFFAFLFSGALVGDVPQTGGEGQIKQLSVKLQVRKIQRKRLLKYEVNLLYQSNGTMISHFLPPNNRYLITNRNGDLQIYSPDSNRVKMTRNEWVSSDGAILGLFLRGETETMGMEEGGFEMKEVRTEDSLRIANWERAGLDDAGNPMTISNVEMVHGNGKLMYLGYLKPDGSFFKKSYFSNYVQVNGIWLPGRSTEILWVGKDSIVEDTRFVDYLVNEAADTSLVNFKIPEDAEIY